LLRNSPEAGLVVVYGAEVCRDGQLQSAVPPPRRLPVPDRHDAPRVRLLGGALPPGLAKDVFSYPLRGQEWHIFKDDPPRPHRRANSHRAEHSIARECTSWNACLAPSERDPELQRPLRPLRPAY